MKGIDIIEALGGIDPELVADAKRHKRSVPRWLKWSALAACLCCAAGLTLLSLWRLLQPSASISLSAAYTQEELFLQDAYWYLQSDEKELFTWENGVLEDFCTEESREVISPEGLTDIQGMDLLRVSYCLGRINDSAWDQVSLYFTADGGFVGTDYSTVLDGAERQQLGFWTGDITYWLFLSQREITMDGTQTITCVLRNTGTQTRTITTYAPSCMFMQYFQDGESHSSGIDASARELTLASGEVYVETHTMTPAEWNEAGWMPYTLGECTLLTSVEWHEGNDGLRAAQRKTATFSIVEEPSGTSEASLQEERFLQEAYWYLQSDEKELFTWENGVLEDFCAEESHVVIGPEGETDIQGMALKRVRYYYTKELLNGTSPLEESVNLYFDGDGQFVGTDVWQTFGDEESQEAGRYWDSDIAMWLFLSAPEVAQGDSLEVICVLKNISDGTRALAAYAPDFLWLEVYQDGLYVTGGIDSAAQYLTLEPGDVVVERHTISDEAVTGTPGEYTLLGFVKLEDFSELPWLQFTLWHTGTFTVVK